MAKKKKSPETPETPAVVRATPATPATPIRIPFDRPIHVGRGQSLSVSLSILHDEDGNVVDARNVSCEVVTHTADDDKTAGAPPHGPHLSQLVRLPRPSAPLAATVSPPTPHAAEPIRVWRFDDAPEELRALSTNGGDEDWLAVLPTYLKDEYVGWLQSGTSFGCCRVEEIAYIYEGRSVCVAVGSHA